MTKDDRASRRSLYARGRLREESDIDERSEAAAACCCCGESCLVVGGAEAGVPSGPVNRVLSPLSELPG